MEETVKHIGEYGVLIVIAAAFIWDKIQFSRTTGDILRELQTSIKMQTHILEALQQTCNNLTTALSIIQNTLATNTSALDRHDKRVEYMNKDLIEILTLIRK